MYRIVEKRNIFFALSLILLIPGLIAWVVWGLRLGIDFTGGTLLRGTYASSVPATSDIEKAVRDAGIGSVHVQTSEERGVILRMEHISNEQHDAIVAALEKQDASFTEASFETIGPTIGAELKRKAVVATILVLALIVVYVTWAFRKVSAGPVPSWVYGGSAIVALVHDVGIVVGVFAILGHFYSVEVDALFVTALLTVLGFSVHDTIVVYDRIRERVLSSVGKRFEEVVNESLNQTMVRSINTSLTAIFILIALVLFGGGSIQYFILALLIGIAAGTYSSIFVAASLLVVWNNWKQRKRV